MINGNSGSVRIFRYTEVLAKPNALATGLAKLAEITSSSATGLASQDDLIKPSLDGFISMGYPH